MDARTALEADALHAFDVFARHRNLTHAAAELHVSQPALHVKLSKLSRAMGTPLYEREGRSLVLTPAGERLATYARDSQRRLDDFLHDVDGAERTLTIAAGRAATRWVISAAIGSLHKAGHRVRLVTADRADALAMLSRGTADVAVWAFDPPPPQFENQELAAFPQTLIVPRTHHLANRRSVRLADLDGMDVALPPVGRPHRQALERAMLAAGASWQVAAEADDWDLLLHLAEMGIGATVVNGCVPPSEKLAAVPIRDLPKVRYWAAWRTQRSDAARRLVDRAIGQ